MKVGINTYIHPTALIGPNVTIGEGCYIGPYCIIGFPPEYKGKEDIDEGVWIGNNVRITGAVTIDSGTEGVTKIGSGCYLMKHSHIGHDAWLQFDVVVSCGAKIGGHAIIGDKTNIGLNACIHQRTQIPMGCMIGMGAVVTKKTELLPNKKYAGVPARIIGDNVR